MFYLNNDKGSIEVSQDAIQGMLSQYIDEKKLEDVKFLGFKRSGSGVAGVAESVTKFFVGNKRVRNEDGEATNLIFNLDFQILKIHPVHIKGQEIQALIHEATEKILGITSDQIQVNVYFSKFKEEDDDKRVR